MKIALSLVWLLLTADAEVLPPLTWSFMCRVTSGSITVIEDWRVTTTSEVLQGTFVYEHFKEASEKRKGTAVLVVSGTPAPPGSTTVPARNNALG